MKLYVWENMLEDYGPGIMFALAHDVEEAREFIITANGYGVEEYRAWRCGALKKRRVPTMWSDLKAKPECVTTPKGFAVWGGA